MKKGDILVVKDSLNQERIRVGLPIINEDLTGKEVRFINRDISVNREGENIEMIRVTGVEVTRDLKGAWNDIPMDIRELLVPLTTFNLK